MTRNRASNGFTVLELLFAISLISALAVGSIVFIFNPMLKNRQAHAIAQREKAINLLLARYEIDSIEVNYETTDPGRVVSRDQAGRLDNLRFKTELRPVLTIDGIRRADCRIVGELTEDPRLDCTDGLPNEQ
jgi:prepilin-type N-terminal cleavage/methylation domain-containing protein